MAQFRIDQASPGAGIAGQSRHDLVAGEVINLVATDPLPGSGVSYTWEIIDAVGSGAALTATTGDTTSIGPAGSITAPCGFKIRLTANDNGNVSSVERLASVRATRTGLRPALFGERSDGANKLASNDPDLSTDNANYPDLSGRGAPGQNWRGVAEWAWEILSAIEQNAEDIALISGGNLQTAYDAGSTIQTSDANGSIVINDAARTVDGALLTLTKSVRNGDALVIDHRAATGFSIASPAGIDLELGAGAGSGTQAGGSLNLYAGAGANEAGGGMLFRAGDGAYDGVTAHAGGAITIRGGTAGSGGGHTGGGGDVVIDGGQDPSGSLQHGKILLATTYGAEIESGNTTSTGGAGTSWVHTGPLRISDGTNNVVEMSIAGVLTLRETTAPGGVADKGHVYTKDVGGTTHLYFQDSGGTEWALTGAAAGYSSLQEAYDIGNTIAVSGGNSIGFFNTDGAYPLLVLSANDPTNGFAPVVQISMDGFMSGPAVQGSAFGQNKFLEWADATGYVSLGGNGVMFETFEAAISGGFAAFDTGMPGTSLRVESGNGVDGDAVTPGGDGGNLLLKSGSGGVDRGAGAGMYGTVTVQAGDTTVATFQAPAGVNPQLQIVDGSPSAPGIAFTSNPDTGLHWNGTTFRAAVDSTDVLSLASDSIASLFAHRFNVGSESNPGIGFSGESNTGWYRPSAGVMSATIQGVRSFDFQSGALILRSSGTGYGVIQQGTNNNGLEYKGNVGDSTSTIPHLFSNAQNLAASVGRQTYMNIGVPVAQNSAGGTAEFTALRVNVTKDASHQDGTDNRLLDLATDSVPVFTVQDTGRVRVAEASATDPAIASLNDTTTGISPLFAGGTRQIAFSVGGVWQGSIYSSYWRVASAIVINGGSATSPAFQFSGDAQTGFYWVSAGTMGFSCAGSLRVQVNNQGIQFNGTDSASAPAYSKVGDTNTGLFFPAAGSPAITCDTHEVTRWSWQPGPTLDIGVPGDTQSTLAYLRLNSGDGTTARQIEIQSTTGGALALYADNDGIGFWDQDIRDNQMVGKSVLVAGNSNFHTVGTYDEGTPSENTTWRFHVELVGSNTMGSGATATVVGVWEYNQDTGTWTERVSATKEHEHVWGGILPSYQFSRSGSAISIQVNAGTFTSIWTCTAKITRTTGTVGA